MTLANACATCCRNCFKLHKKKPDDPPMASFFKLMFGKKFDQYLVVPPKFSRKLESVAEKKLTLYDTNSDRWDVLLTNMNGSLAFQQGWRNFVVDHDIDIGDLLVFYLFRDSQFLVEIYGRSACQKFPPVKKTNKDGPGSYVPLKRPSGFFYEQSSHKRQKNLNTEKEPSFVPRRVSSRENNLPKVVPSPMAETWVDPCSRTRRDKYRTKVAPDAQPHVQPRMMNQVENRPKVVPVPVTETWVDPCSMDRRDKYRSRVAPMAQNPVELCMTNLVKNKPEVVPIVETVGEPCFITSRDKNIGPENDRDVLFDLSAFEMPPKSAKKSTIDREEEASYQFDLPNLPETETETETDANKTGQVSGSFEADYQFDLPDLPETETDVNKTSQVSGSFEANCQFDLPDLPEIETNAHKTSHVSGSFENVVTGVEDKDPNIHKDYGDNFQNDETVRNTEPPLSEFGEAELLRCEPAPLPSSSPDVDLAIDSIAPLEIIAKPETALSGGKMKLNNQEPRVCSQDIFGNGEGGGSLRSKFSTSEQNLVDLGGPLTCKMKVKDNRRLIPVLWRSGENIRGIKQESRNVKQDIYGDASNSGNISRMKQESRNVEQDICNNPMVDCSFGGDYLISEPAIISCGDFAENFKPVVKIEGCPNKIVKLEPLVCAPSATAVKVTCSVPPDSKHFLELPEPLPAPIRVIKTRIKPKHQLLFLHDHAGTLWPVVYHNNRSVKVLTDGWNSFATANNILPDDECIFTLEDTEEPTFIVQVVRHLH